MKVSQLLACVLLTATSAVLVSCGGGAKSVIVPPPVTDVYVAGFQLGNSTGISGLYWKNGTPVTIAGGIPGYINAITVSGNDVYLAGLAAGSRYDVATYWKNGIPVTLTDGTTEIPSVRSIFVSGTDVYVAGRDYVLGTDNGSVAVYWKNGVKVPLSDGTQAAQAFSIQVSGPDVYVAGDEIKPIFVPPSTITNYRVAKYWKNGVPVELTDGTQEAGALSMFVSGSDVYAGGFACRAFPSSCSATYWKNGAPVALSTVNGTLATSIIVSGSNVYALGAQLGAGMLLWKNGTPVTLGGSEYTEANQVVVSGQDVYVAGARKAQQGAAIQATYWKNGVPVELPVGPDTAQSYATSIAVVTH